MEVADVINKSADLNVVQLVGKQAGQPIVADYDLASYFGGHFRTVPQLKLYHHFHFTNSQPGSVVLKEFADSVEKSYTMVVDDEWSTEPLWSSSFLASPSPGNSTGLHRSWSTVAWNRGPYLP